MTLFELQAYVNHMLSTDPDSGSLPVLIRDGNNGMILKAGSLRGDVVNMEEEVGGPILDMADGDEYVEIYGE